MDKFLLPLLCLDSFSYSVIFSGTLSVTLFRKFLFSYPLSPFPSPFSLPFPLLNGLPIPLNPLELPELPSCMLSLWIKIIRVIHIVYVVVFIIPIFLAGCFRSKVFPYLLLYNFIRCRLPSLLFCSRLKMPSFGQVFQRHVA